MTELDWDGRGTAGSRRSFVDDLNQAARENPVSACLIGAGIAWMLMGSSRRALFSGAGAALGTVGRGTHQAAGMAASGVQNAASAAASGIRQVASATASGIGSAAESLGSAVSAVGNTASDVARSVGSSASGMVSGAAKQAGSNMDSAYEYGSDAAGRASRSVASGTSDMSHAAQERISEWSSGVRSGLADSFEQQPLLLGALGMALGAAVAAALPATEAENRILGEASDGFKQMVTDLVAEKADAAKGMAQTVLEGAEAAGLTPKAATQAVQDLVGKLGTVAEKSGGSLKESVSGAMAGKAPSH